MIQAALRALPLFLPLTAAGAVAAAAVSSRLARLWQLSAFRLWLFLSGVIAYLALTVTPAGPLSEFGTPRGSGGSSGGALILPSMPPLAEFLRPDDASLNTLAGVGLGFAAVFLTGRIRAWPTYVALALPVMSETVQMLLPILGRVGAAFSDVPTAWLGTVIGAVIGLGAARLARLSPSSSAPRPHVG